MRKIFRVLAVGPLLAALPAAGLAQAQTRAEGKAPQVRAFPNLTPIYRITGVADSGSASNAGVATSVHCTNFTASNQQVQYIVRSAGGTQLANPTFVISARRTFTLSTHFTAVFAEGGFLTPATLIAQGSMIIKATTPKVHCSAMIIDAAASVPSGIALSLTRLNQEKGAQE